MVFYSASKRGFFNDAIHTDMPSDVLLITEELYIQLLTAQGSGKVIQPDHIGMPVAVDPVPSDSDVQATLKAKAQAALDKSDITLIRCIEHGVSIPEDWVKYRADLRDVINGLVHAMPYQPKFPANT